MGGVATQLVPVGSPDVTSFYDSIGSVSRHEVARTLLQASCVTCRGISRNQDSVPQEGREKITLSTRTPS
jgi:hypothetical protein